MPAKSAAATPESSSTRPTGAINGYAVEVMTGPLRRHRHGYQHVHAGLGRGPGVLRDHGFGDAAGEMCYGLTAAEGNHIEKNKKML